MKLSEIANRLTGISTRLETSPAHQVLLVVALGSIAAFGTVKKPVEFPGPQARLQSPDGRYVVENLDSDKQPHHTLLLKNRETGPYNYNTSKELTSTPSGNYTYDSNGNEKSKPDGTTYFWDSENRLTQVILPGSGGTVNFKYDPFGRRIQKASASSTTDYLYDGANILETLSSSGSVLARYTDSLNIDEPLTQLASGTTNYYEQDGLGSVTSLTNSSGARGNTYTYDSYRIPTATGTTANPFQFTGREFDSETGTYYYRARYYDQRVGRFISEDPARFRSGVNFYPYVDNNPADEIDPLGLLPKGKDRWWGYNDKNFRRWWHRCYWNGEPYDGSQEEIAAAYEIWISLGKPEDCGGKKKPCEQPQEEPAPDPTLIPKPDPNKVLTWGLILGTGAAIAEEYGWIAIFF